MKRRIRLVAVSSAVVLLTAIFGVTAPATASSSSDVTTWFANLTLDQISPFVGNFPSWSSEGSNDPKAVSFGKPAPTLGYSLPSYDLNTNEVTGSARLDKGLTLTGEYCARVLVNQKPIDVVVCAQPAANGGYQLFSANEVDFLNGSADLSSAGTTGPGHDFVGVVGDAVVPMDAAAQSWLGTSKLDGSTFVRLVAEQKAEWNAIDRINGPTVGGGIPLIGGNQSDVAAFEASVSRGSGIPVSRLSHPHTVAEAEGKAKAEGKAGNSTSVAAWLVPVVTLAALLAVAFMATVRRRRTRAARP